MRLRERKREREREREGERELIEWGDKVEFMGKQCNEGEKE